MKMLAEDGPIDLAKLSDALCNQLVELNYLRLEPGQTVFSPGRPAEAVEQAIRDFADYVTVDEGYEAPLRRALAFLLNLGDEELSSFTVKLQMAFPTGDVAQKREFLRRLWDAAFADWRIDGFDASAFELKWSH